ncbi:hypothetical protein Amet_3449 [Alkaliphilus metalliredigens QYMF]|uniref:Uncharacterized protein n=1 Tax=Alkaliphilus metalliredigens (strain QYMF) TaxID=293826 RepID=A6TTQ9_ALKMQ|nr:hypothetical protein [Alkaliphilus metalliredigens]ABR49577.1 hypothetical protein Amet_3449 [Alkaliphilus metalliredigens QYMF]
MARACRCPERLNDCLGYNITVATRCDSFTGTLISANEDTIELLLENNSVQVILCCMVCAITILPISAIDQPFFDDFEDEPLGDVGPGANDGPWAGAADNFAFVVNIDAESIRPNTPIDRFGFQLLRFDNPFAAGSPPSMTIDQASREFNSTPVGLDFETPLILTFDIRTIQTVSLNPGIHAEVNIGRARAGRFVFTTDPAGELRAVLFSGSPPTPVFFSEPLVFGQWYRISYELDVANNRYNYIEIDGIRFDNDGEGWEANVGVFGTDIQHVLLIQGSSDADQEGIYFDNVSIWAPITCNG